MTIAYVSVLELFIVAVMSLISLAVPAGVAYLVWTTWKGRQEATTDRPRGEGVFTEAVVGTDGVLRAEVPLGPRWAGRPVRIVVEAIGPL
jgi:hypothetical protein